MVFSARPVFVQMGAGIPVSPDRTDFQMDARPRSYKGLNAGDESEGKCAAVQELLSGSISPYKGTAWTAIRRMDGPSDAL
jgi:hypothetical protein